MRNTVLILRFEADAAGDLNLRVCVCFKRGEESAAVDKMKAACAGPLF